MTDPLISLGGSAESKVREMEMAPYMRGTRGKLTIAAAVAVAAAVDLFVTFDKTLPTADYAPQVTLEGPSTLLGGSLTAMVKANGREVGGCWVTVKNSALVSLGLNAVIHVTATY